MMPNTHKFLLLLACSQRKYKNPGFLPAIERYDGVNFRVLQKAKRDGHLLLNLDILILSAQYGLISANTPIANYDLLMSKSRVAEIRNDTGIKFDAFLRDNPYEEVFINLGKTYVSALATSKLLVSDSIHVIYAVGGIGKKMSQMKSWLYKLD